MADIEFSLVSPTGNEVRLGSDLDTQEPYRLMLGTGGFGLAPTKARFEASAGVGQRFLGSLPDARPMTVRIDTFGLDRMDTMQRLRVLASYLRYREGHPLPVLRARFATGEVWELPIVYDGKGGEDTYTELGEERSSWPLSVVAPHPYWTARDPLSFTLRQEAEGLGLLPELAKLQVSSGAVIGSVDVTNPGDVDADVLWRVTGPGDSLAISSGGRGFEFGPIGVGETIIFDGRDGTVTDQDGVNRYDGLGDAPKFPRLPAGRSTVMVEFAGASSGVWEDTGEVIATNLCPLPSFEASNNGAWRSSGLGVGGGFDRSQEWSDRGEWSAKVTSTSASAGDIRSATGDFTSFAWNMMPGATYTIEAKIYLPVAPTNSGSRSRRILFWYATPDAPTTYREIFGPQAPAIAGAHTLTHTVTVPAEASGCIVGVGCQGVTDGEPFVTYVDSVCVSERAGYFDGDTARKNGAQGFWTGEPHASTSELHLMKLTGVSSVTAEWKPQYEVIF